MFELGAQILSLHLAHLSHLKIAFGALLLAVVGEHEKLYNLLHSFSGLGLS